MLRASDLDVTHQQVAFQLASSGFLAGRRGDSPPIRIVIRRVENLTSDVLPPAELWMAVARVQGSLPVQDLARERNIVFQLPPEEVAALRRAGFEVPLTPENRPTHALRAVFRSSTRSGSSSGRRDTDTRKEYYFLEYMIVNLATRELEWEGSFEFAREASGLVVN